MNRFALAIAATLVTFWLSGTASAFDIVLKKFKCNNQQESDLSDEIYFEITADGKDVAGWGDTVQYKGKRNQTTTIDRKITAPNTIVINVFEKDAVNSDSLGSITISSAGAGDKKLSGEINAGKFDYEFFWE
jgi:hypothetical protein